METLKNLPEHASLQPSKRPAKKSGAEKLSHTKKSVIF